MIANILAMPPQDLMPCMLKKEGDRIAIDEPLAQTKGIFGLFKNAYKSKHEGTIETISDVTGQVIIRGAPVPVEVKVDFALPGADVETRSGAWW